MDDFTRELGVGLLHLLWQLSGGTDPEDDSKSTRSLVVSEVVDRLRGESLDREVDLRQLSVEFADLMSGRPYDNRAKQFADDFVSFVTGEEPLETFLASVDNARRSIPKRKLSEQELAD